MRRTWDAARSRLLHDIGLYGVALSLRHFGGSYVPA
jgi:hypothetical protein